VVKLTCSILKKKSIAKIGCAADYASRSEMSLPLAGVSFSLCLQSSSVHRSGKCESKSVYV